MLIDEKHKSTMALIMHVEKGPVGSLPFRRLERAEPAGQKHLFCYLVLS